MIASIKNKALFSLLIFAVLLVVLFEVPRDIYNLKLPAFVFLAIIASWIDYNRGYLDGKAYYTEDTPEFPLKAAEGWDHKQSLQELINEHPFCLMELDHAPCIEHDYPLPSGRIHLLQNCKHYTTLELVDDGWRYACDTDFPKDVVKLGKYQPMLTKEAIRISHDKIWDLYF